MAPVAAIAAVAGTALSAAGTISQANAQADAARRNADIAEKNAQFIELQTDEDIDLFMDQARQIEASARVSIGGSGFLFGATEQDIFASNAMKIQEDIERIRLKGQRQAEIVRAGGEAQRESVSGIQTAGILGGLGQLAGGFGQAFRPNRR